MEIEKGRANAILLLGELLALLSEKCELSLASFEGGVADNAIPAEASATVTASIDPCELIRVFKESMAQEYRGREEGLEITCEVVGEVHTNHAKGGQ